MLTMLLFHIMSNLVFDACSLIYLTKIQMKEKLPLLGKVIISEAVKNEVIADLNKFPDSQIIKTNLKKNIIQETDLKLKEVPLIKNLGRGEKETIEICVRKGGIPITDDHQAINYAITRGLKPKTTEIILLDFLREEIITLQEFKIVFKNLASIKLLKTNVIAYIKKKAEKIVNNKKKTIK